MLLVKSELLNQIEKKLNQELYHGHWNKSKINSNINNQIKKVIYNKNMHHPQVVKSPIFNYWMKVKIADHTELKLF